MTRTRTVITGERSREVQRLEKLLEDTGIKLSAVASDITGVSGRAMLEALIAGTASPAALADLDIRIGEAMRPLTAARELLMSIPGVSKIVAEVLLAETGADTSVFPTTGHLASWAGTAPGCNESAGRVKSTKTRPGNRYLKGALGTAELAASQSKGTYLSTKYRRIAGHRGPMKALVAVEHSVLVAVWSMLTNGEFYRDPGADYYTARQPARTKARAISQLEPLGYRVTLESLTRAG